jgi:N-acetylmuramoyl-L-alanine amidase
MTFEADQPGVRLRPSPNFGERKNAGRPDMILLHYTGMPTGEGAEDWLCDPASQVSSHYLVHEDGGIVQMVRESDRAWHAGKSSWRGATDINSLSVGIEIVNPGHSFGYVDFPDVQVEAVVALCRGIVERHAIRPERVLAHSDVSPGRKIDPGERFPWQRLHVAGIGHWVEPAALSGGPRLCHGDSGEAVGRLQNRLSAYGYGLAITGEFDAVTSTVVAAFQRHFRPTLVDGIADASTVKTLERLTAALAV